MKTRLLFSALLIIVTIVTFGQDPEFEYYKNKEMKTLLGRDRAGGGYGSFTT